MDCSRLTPRANVETSKIDIFPLRVCRRSKLAFAGTAGQYILRQGLGVLKEIKIGGEVRIRLVGNHELCPTGKHFDKCEKICPSILRDVKGAMMVRMD